MRKFITTFSLLAALVCAISPSAFAHNNRAVGRSYNVQRGSVQRYGQMRQQRQYGSYGQMQQQRQYGSYGQMRQQRQYGSYGQMRQQRQYGTNGQYMRQQRQYGTNGQRDYRRGFGDVREFGRNYNGHRYYGDHFVGIGIGDWGVYGYPYPYLFSDCYEGDWIFSVPSRGRWSVRVRILDYDGYAEIVTAFWDPYLGGYYYFDPDMGYIEVLD